MTVFKKIVLFSEKFVPVGNCTQRGDEEIWGYEKLCTACQGVYILSEDCFPAFFNSVVCDNSEKDCIFDQYTALGKIILNLSHNNKTLNFYSPW